MLDCFREVAGAVFEATGASLSFDDGCYANRPAVFVALPLGDEELDLCSEE
jgi:hypothetical protein